MYICLSKEACAEVDVFISPIFYKTNLPSSVVVVPILAQTYLQLPLRQWGAGNVYLLVLSSWKVNIAENSIALMGL